MVGWKNDSIVDWHTCTVRHFFSDETQLKNGKMAAVLHSKLLGKISLLPVREVASGSAV